MEIFIYSDESGVFDQAHYKYFVFGGLIFLSRESKDDCARKYLHAERTIRENGNFPAHMELKASALQTDDKRSLFRSLNQVQKFGVVVHQSDVLSRIYQSKKDKQRYLDYVFKIGAKRALEHLIEAGDINSCEVNAIRFYVDEHTTATNGRYELREALEQELRYGTYNMTWDKHFPPIFQGLQSVDLQFCNSSKMTLVRAADIVANRILWEATYRTWYGIRAQDLFVIKQP